MLLGTKLFERLCKIILKCTDYRLKGFMGSFCTDTAKASSSELFGGQPHREEMICVDFFVNLVLGEMTLIYYFSSIFMILVAILSVYWTHLQEANK